MNKKKKIVCGLLIIFVLTNINNVSASSGALRESSIKTCPNGKMYGQHSSDNHWHEAEYTPREKGSNYSAVGDAIYNDPCSLNNEEANIDEVINTQQVEVQEETQEVVEEEKTVIAEEIPEQTETNIEDNNTTTDSVPTTSNNSTTVSETNNESNNHSSTSLINSNDISNNEDDTSKTKVKESESDIETTESNDNDVKSSEILTTGIDDEESNEEEGTLIDSLIGLGVIGAGGGAAYLGMRKRK